MAELPVKIEKPTARRVTVTLTVLQAAAVAEAASSALLMDDMPKRQERATASGGRCIERVLEDNGIPWPL